MIDIETVFEVEASNVSEKKTWYNVNDLKKSEIKPYKVGYNPLNPFKVEDKVTLRLTDHSRYSLIDGINADMVGSVSEVLGNNMVNIAYWDTRPSVIKNVPIKSVVLSKNNKLSVKLRFLFKTFLRKLFDPNKFPKSIEAEIKSNWGN